MEPKTLQQAIIYFSDTDRCLRYLADARWPDGVAVCPTCGRRDVTYVTKRRVWQCKTRHPKAQFSIKVGTIFEDSPIPLSKWLPCMWMLANCKNGISSWEIHRALKVTQKTAWFMLHRVRLSMRDENNHQIGGNGAVEVDETFVGPKPQKMHRAKRLKMQSAEHGNTKAVVMGMLDRDMRKVRAKVIPNVRRDVLQRQIIDGVKTGSTVYTDGFPGYDRLLLNGYLHQVINHTKEYVRGQVHTQGIDNFWSLLKRGLTGTYVAVEPFHLERYVDEQAFRYNNRATKDNPLDDGDRFAFLVTQILGRRLTYKELTGKADARPF
jgi:transposase-like protein